LPDVVAIGEKYLTNLRNDAIASRVSYAVHDFFAPQPQPAEVFLVRMVLHYWSPEDCVRILQQLASAMASEKSRIIVMDTVLPMPGRISSVVERQLRVRDLAMLQLHGNHERTEEDWNTIFASTNPPLRVVETNLPFGSEMSIMELAM
jgi:6-hydroxytryprostatin B O-methyltransferase